MLAEDEAARPSSVRWAVALAVLAFAVALVNTYRVASGVTSQANPLVLWFYTAASSALWLFLLFLVHRGRNWARIVFVVVALLGIPGTVVANLAQAGDLAVRVVSGLQALLNAGAALLLLIPSSRRWYQHLKAVRVSSAA